VRDTLPSGAYATACETTKRFVARALADVGRDEPLLLALPCEFSGSGQPLGSTYCWGDPEVNFVVALEKELRRAPGTIEYMNDAELAGHAAQRDLHGRTAGVVLVLTIGFGVGGAMLLPRV